MVFIGLLNGRTPAPRPRAVDAHFSHSSSALNLLKQNLHKALILPNRSCKAERKGCWLAGTDTARPPRQPGA